GRRALLGLRVKHRPHAVAGQGALRQEVPPVARVVVLASQTAMALPSPPAHAHFYGCSPSASISAFVSELDRGASRPLHGAGRPAGGLPLSGGAPVLGARGPPVEDARAAAVSGVRVPRLLRQAAGCLLRLAL